MITDQLKPTREQAISGTVIGRNGGTYRIRTGSGREITATSAIARRVGSNVTVLSGEIVGESGNLVPAKTYTV